MKKLLLAMLATATIGAASAATLSNTLTINGWVTAACVSALENPQAMTFTFTGTTAPTPGENTLNITCTTDTKYNVVLYSGNGAVKPTAQTFALLNSELTDPAQYPIAYKVGSATGGSQYSSIAQGSPLMATDGTGTGDPIPFPIFISPAAAGGSYPAGNYSDTLTFNTIY